jgi:hypothetical protein
MGVGGEEAGCGVHLPVVEFQTRESPFCGTTRATSAISFNLLAGTFGGIATDTVSKKRSVLPQEQMSLILF